MSVFKISELVVSMQNIGVLHLTTPWDDADYRPGDPVNVIGGKEEIIDGERHLYMGMQYGGYVIHFPDLLLGGTRVTSSGDCSRRGYLGERVAGEGTTAACLKGTIYHSMFQQALAKGYRRGDQLKYVAREIVDSIPEALLDSELTPEEAEGWLRESIPSTLRYAA